MNLRALFLLILLYIQAYPAHAQLQLSTALSLPGLKVDNWQMDQGLPVNSVMTIAQSADGWMFFGTEEGFVKFDGTAFALINKSNIPGLKVNFISTLLGGRDTSLWIGTEGDGLLRYKNNTYTKFTKANGLSDNRVYTLNEDPQGGLWVGTSGGGVNFLKSGIITTYDTMHGLANNYVRAIALDPKGRIWIGTQKGLSVIENGKIRNYFKKDGLSDDFIETLAFDKAQNLWIGTKGGGVNVFKQNKFFVYTEKDGLTNNAVTALCFDTNEVLWIGTNGGGITRMANGKFSPFTTKEGLSSNLIVALFHDREGNVWAGTSGAGIDRIKRKSIQTLTSRDGLPGDVILPVFEDHQGVLWFGVAGKGLCRLVNGRVQNFSRPDGLPDHLVLTIGEDLNYNLWIGTAGGGLSCFKNKKFITYTTENGLSNNVVVAVYCDRAGILWAGTTGGGINRFSDGKFSSITTKQGLSNDNVNSILEDREGNLWVGTNNGLNKIRDNKIIIINEQSGLSNDYVLSLYEDPEKNLWVGTADGLNLITNGKITKINTQDGLVNDVVLKILEDDFGYFWISCNKGIYKVRKQDLLDFAGLKRKSIIPVSYGKADGLESTECNGGISPAGCRARDGRLLFPTMKGISVIDPKMMNIVSSDFSPIFIEEFFVDGQVVDISSPVSIPSYSNRLEFRFAALNYTNPGRISYRYILTGFDKHWIECGTHRMASYTNIPSGTYTFKVMASNANGQWDERKYSELKFQLKPLFFRSFTFYFIAVVLILLLIFFVSYYFIERFHRNRLSLLVEKRTQELHQKMIAQMQTQEELQKTNFELLIAKEQAESSDRLKSAFMKNISHEIRTPLNGILGFNELLAEPDLTNEERKHYFAIIRSNSDRLMNTVTEYMDMSLIASGNQEVVKKVFSPGDLLNEIYDQFIHTCLTKKLELEIQISAEGGNLQINSDYVLLKKVLCHLLDNAVKFTDNGKVRYGFEVKSQDLQFFVKDTGVGINPQLYEAIFDTFTQENLSDTRGHEGSGLGLSIVKGIVKLLGGRIWVESIKGEGSSFFLTIPFEKNSFESPVISAIPVTSTCMPLVLVADDDTSASLLVERILDKEGVKVMVVTDGQKAVDACRQTPEISLVLMDIKMPFLDGLAATKLIKAHNPLLPVIAITAYAQSGDENRALEAGCNDYIAKPYTRELLTGKLKKYGIIR